MWRTKSIATFIYTIIALTTFINAALAVTNLQTQSMENLTSTAMWGLLAVLNAFACVITGFAAWDTTSLINQQKKDMEPKADPPKIQEVFEPGSSEPRGNNAA